MSAPEQEHGLQVTDALKESEQAISTMPEKTRSVFLMRRVDGLSYREIHEKLGISISSVECHMVREHGHLSAATTEEQRRGKGCLMWGCYGGGGIHRKKNK